MVIVSSLDSVVLRANDIKYMVLQASESFDFPKITGVKKDKLPKLVIDHDTCQKPGKLPARHIGQRDTAKVELGMSY